MAPEVYQIAHSFPVNTLINCYLGDLERPNKYHPLFGPRSELIRTGPKSKTERVKTSPMLLLKLILKNVSYIYCANDFPILTSGNKEIILSPRQHWVTVNRPYGPRLSLRHSLAGREESGTHALWVSVLGNPWLVFFQSSLIKISLFLPWGSISEEIE